MPSLHLYEFRFQMCYKILIAVRQSSSPTALFCWCEIWKDLSILWSYFSEIHPSLQLLFPNIFCVSLHACLCIPHESTSRAPNSNCETMYQYLIGLLNTIIVINRTESSCLRVDVFLQKKLTAFFFFLRAVKIIIKMLQSRNNTNKPVSVGGKKKPTSE